MPFVVVVVLLFFIFYFLFIFPFLAKLSFLLLKNDNIHYHSQRFLLSGYIAFSK